jgi:threonine dehydrogenase-like Zn-dependent dehydrogenase
MVRRASCRDQGRGHRRGVRVRPGRLFTILSARLQGAGRVLAVDHVTSRLQQARRPGAEVIDFDREDPVETLKRLTGGLGPDRVIDAVGIDAESAGSGHDQRFSKEVEEIAPEQPPEGSRFRRPGDAPSQALRWEVEAIAKAGTLAIVGVYPPNAEHFPIGAAMDKTSACWPATATTASTSPSSSSWCARAQSDRPRSSHKWVI